MKMNLLTSLLKYSVPVWEGPEVGAAGAAPSPEPAAPPPAPAQNANDSGDDESETSESFDFDALDTTLEDFDDQAKPEPKQGAEPEPGKEEPKPEPEAGKPAEPAKAAPQEPNPDAQPKPEPQAQPPQEPEATQASNQPVSLPELINAFQEKGKELTDALAVKNFQLTQEEVDELETDVVQAVPKLLAKAQVKAVQASLAYMQQFVPQIIASHMAMTNEAQTTEGKFFEQFPQLNREAHGEMIRTVSHSLKQANPQLTMEQLMQLTGNVVMQQFGIQAQAPNAQPAPAAQPTPAFVPVGSTRVTPTSPAPQNPWAGMGQEFDD